MAEEENRSNGYCQSCGGVLHIETVPPDNDPLVYCFNSCPQLGKPSPVLQKLKDDLKGALEAYEEGENKHCAQQVQAVIDGIDRAMKGGVL